MGEDFFLNLSNFGTNIKRKPIIVLVRDYASRSQDLGKYKFDFEICREMDKNEMVILVDNIVRRPHCENKHP